MIKEFYCKGTPLTPTNREAGSVERPFLFKFISFQFDLNSFNLKKVRSKDIIINQHEHVFIQN